MARLREGRTHRPLNLAHFLRRVRHAGARGQLTMRADSGFYTHAVVASAIGWMSASPSPSASTKACTLIEAIPEDAWTPIPYWMDGLMWQKPPTSPVVSSPRVIPGCRAGAAHRPAGGSPVPSGSPTTAITASSPTGKGRCSNWRPTRKDTCIRLMPFEKYGVGLNHMSVQQRARQWR